MTPSKIINLVSLDLYSIADLPCDYPQQILQLSVTHSHLQSLEGIELYPNLQKIDIRYNSITDPVELTRIDDYSTILQLNIQGNQIEYRSQCMYVSLKQMGFINLKTFNNRDYSRWKDKKSNKRRNKKVNMNKIYTKADQLNRDMKKTLKNSIKASVLDEYRAVYEEEEYSHDNITDQTTQRNPSSYHKKYPYQDYLSQDKNSTKEISLQNANFVKSVSNQDYESCKSMQDKIRKNYQQNAINQLELDVHEVPNVLQPTATFASQRQREAVPFRSKNTQKSIIGIYLEDDPNTVYEQEDNFETNSFGEGQQRSFQSDYSSFSQRNTHNQTGYSRYTRTNGMGNSYLSNLSRIREQQIEDMARAFYLKQLIDKVFRGFRMSNSVNMPLKSKQNCF